MGHPISHSTNRGFKVRRVAEDLDPSGIAGTGREERERSATKFGSC